MRSEQDEEDDDEEIPQRFDPARYLESIWWIGQGDSGDQCPYFYAESHPMEYCAEDEASPYRKQKEIFLGFSDFFGYPRDEIFAQQVHAYPQSYDFGNQTCYNNGRWSLFYAFERRHSQDQ